MSGESVAFFYGKTICYYYVGSTGYIESHKGEKRDANKILFKGLSKFEKSETLHIILDIAKNGLLLLRKPKEKRQQTL